jgi:uncharacterized protein (DUF2235 family)
MTLRNLMLLFDGTWNLADDDDNNMTNVEKIYRLLPFGYDTRNVYYGEGVGVKSGEGIFGGMFGVGIDDRIFDVYRFLQRRFAEKGFENRLFLFGFSRGAYTARTVAQLLYYCGVPREERDCHRAWDCYYRQDSQAAETLKQSRDFFETDIEMLGVWDTVKSTLDSDRKDRTLYPNVKAAYHAMAIDEKRRNFPVLPFDEATDPRITQVWFSGVHSDIGGGYPSDANDPMKDESKLSDITLKWMVEAAQKRGLEFTPDFMGFLNPDPKGKIHDSCTGKWKLLGESVRHIGSGDNVHSSVKERLNGNVGYCPTNLPPSPKYV